ncbi:hypothetical protein E3N88_09863 [Mikania micrantha]|uniref:Uncharacterized protein n=1 Tax=Mikania micrantha TaxID=192012 RepID=A0A5N6PL70_9ASTR|nr:hypothetical protein E3N88_09863 [Mikania micrantha]
MFTRSERCPNYLLAIKLWDLHQACCEEGMKTGTRSEYIDEAIEEDVYNIGETSKLPVGDKTVAFKSSLLDGGMKTGTRSEKPYESDHEMIGDFISPHDEILTDKFDLSPPEAEVKLGYVSEKEDKAYQRLIKSKKSACFVL